jgi:hypothetical protein
MPALIAVTSSFITYKNSYNIVASTTNLDFVDCLNVKIENNKFYTYGSSSITHNCVKIVSVNSDVYNINFLNNEFTGNTALGANSTGIIFDLQNNGRVISEVFIGDNNRFKYIETGIYFNQSIGINGSFTDVIIQGNKFTDPNGANAFAQKYGILQTVDVYNFRWDISHNDFYYLNPTSVAFIVGGLMCNKAAIYIQGIISGIVSFNNIEKIGDSAANDYTGGIILCNTYCNITNNTIIDLKGDNCYGVVISRDGTDISSNALISKNKIRDLAGTTLSIGIYSFSDYNSSISENIIYEINAGASNGIVIDNTCNKTKIINNNIINIVTEMDYGIYITLYTYTLKICGNNITKTSNPIFVNVTTGAVLWDYMPLYICENNIDIFSDSGIIVSNAGVAPILGVNITQNNFSNDQDAVSSISINQTSGAKICENISVSTNKVITAGIILADSSNALVQNNSLTFLDDTFDFILISATSEKYLIQGNSMTALTVGVVAATSINTAASGSSIGLVCDNTSNALVSLLGTDNPHDNI